MSLSCMDLSPNNSGMFKQVMGVRLLTCRLLVSVVPLLLFMAPASTFMQPGCIAGKSAWARQSYLHSAKKTQETATASHPPANSETSPLYCIRFRASFFLRSTRRTEIYSLKAWFCVFLAFVREQVNVSIVASWDLAAMNAYFPDIPDLIKPCFLVRSWILCLRGATSIWIDSHQTFQRPWNSTLKNSIVYAENFI